MPMKAKSIGYYCCMVLGMSTMAGALWLWWQATGSASEPTGAGAVLTATGSPAASPFARGAALPVEESPTALNSDRSLLGKRVPISAGSKAWRFELSSATGETAAALYTRIVESHGTKDFEAIADFAEVMSRCRLVEQRKQLVTKAKGDPTALAAHIAAIERDLAACGGVPADAAIRSERWLEKAALAGDARAKYVYASVTHLTWFRDPQNISGHPEGFTQYKQRVFEYLDELAAQGHLDSVHRLGVLYFDSRFGNDPALGWAYAMAAFRAQNNHGWQTAMYQHLERLPQSDRAHAMKLAEDIYAKCCR
jgi:hypothetical protein